MKNITWAEAQLLAKSEAWKKATGRELKVSKRGVNKNKGTYGKVVVYSII